MTDIFDFIYNLSHTALILLRGLFAPLFRVGTNQVNYWGSWGYYFVFFILLFLIARYLPRLINIIRGK